eukprot:CFRG0355T1
MENVWARTWTAPEFDEFDFQDIKINVMSYNVYMDTALMKERMNAIAEIIRREQTDAALLQELTIVSRDVFEDAFRSTEYRMLYDRQYVENPKAMHYFNAIVVNKETLEVRENSKCLIKFPGSCMGRHALSVDVVTKNGGVLRLITSHLESLASCSKERVAQLDWIFNKMASLRMPSVFGGDTNIRVKELKQTTVQVRGKKKAKQKTIGDIWSLSGSPMDAKYTWDLTRNDNIKVDNSFNYAAQHQFDKLYLFEGLGIGGVEGSASNFRLVGVNRLPCKVFPSDHFGITATVKFS